MTAQPSPANETMADFYVSPAGSDAAPGTHDQPFRTITHARDAVRALTQRGHRDDITVLLRGGLYTLNETAVFGTEDGGNGTQRICYAAYPGEEPVLSSAVTVGGWRKDDASSRIPAVARGKIWVAALPREVGLFHTMYDGEVRLPRARGDGFTPEIDAFGRDGKGDLRSRTELYFPEGSMLKSWENIDDLELVIRPWALWVMNILPLHSVDEDRRVATTSVPGTYFLTRERYDRFGPESAWVENIIEGLTVPGSWCVDTREGRIYHWPLGDEPGDIYVPRLREYIRVEGSTDSSGTSDLPVENLHFSGFTFVHGARDIWTGMDNGIQHDWELYDKDNAYLRFRGARNCSVSACTFRSGSGAAIRLDLYAQENVIRGNHIHHIGGSGVVLCGYGLGRKDVNKRNLVIGNHIHHIGEVYRHNAAITVNQSGSNRIAHNLIHDTPYNAMSLTGYRPYFVHNQFREAARRGTLEGTDYSWCYRYSNTEACGLREIRSIRWDEIGDLHDFEIDQFETGYSSIFNLMLPFLHLRDNVVEYNEIRDAVQILADGNGIYISDTGSGNVIRHNYLHDMNCSAIRTDAHQRDARIHGNLLVRTGGLSCYNNNQAYNNVIALVSAGVDPDGTANSAGVYYTLDHGGYVDGLVQRNIVYVDGASGPSFRHYNKEATDLQMQVDYNLIWFRDDPARGQRVLEESRAAGYEFHSISADPLFADVENGDFRLAPDSPAIVRLGFEPLEIDRMGIGPTARSADHRGATRT